jgi:hypothetical protein
MRLITNLTIMLVLVFIGLVPPRAEADMATEDEMAQVCRNWLVYFLYYQGTWGGADTAVIDTVYDIVENDTLLGQSFAIDPSGHVVVPILKDLSAIKAYSEWTNIDIDDTVGYPRLVKDVLLYWFRTLGHDSRVAQHQWSIFVLSDSAFDDTVASLAPLAGGDTLCDTRWHQRYPYNGLCPYTDNPDDFTCGHDYPNCAPLAAAQIMKHHNWPAMGDSGHWFNWQGWRYADFSDIYDWDSMLNTYPLPPAHPPCPSLTHEDSAAAELVYEVAVAFEKGPTSNALHVLPTYFRYSPAIDSAHRNMRTKEEWFTLIRDEIEQARPMQYSIVTRVGNNWITRHSIVCDGWQTVDADSQYHINYGWMYPQTAWWAIDGIEQSLQPENEYLIWHIMPLYPCSLAGELPDTVGPGTCYVVDSIYVADGDTVRILAGTSLLFEGSYPLDIYGTLLAEGQEGDSIVFTKGASHWNGLRFLGSGSSACSLAHCVVEEVEATPDHFGGVYCFESSPVFNHCVIRKNFPHCVECTVYGVGVTCRYSSARFMNCTISDNIAAVVEPYHIEGGGVYCYESSPIFEGCTIGGNSADLGGGVYCSANSSPVFVNSILSDNEATPGGGVYCLGSSPIFTNCLISNNSALTVGGGVYLSGSSPIFTHCSLFGNSASQYGGGVYSSNSSPVFNSTIIAFSANGWGIYFANSPESDVEYCDIFGNSWGPFGGNVPPFLGQLDTTNANGDSCDVFSNIFLDPMFVDAASRDFHLRDYSHCIGAGDPISPPRFDMDGHPRPNPPESYPDIGAYENEHAIPCELCGPLSGTLVPGDYLVVCYISVLSTDSLELMPGTVFNFDGPYGFNIYGTLLAEGTQADSIVFTWANQSHWRSLRFLGASSSGSQLDYCVVRNSLILAEEPDTVYIEEEGKLAVYVRSGAGVFCYGSSPAFNHCTIEHNHVAGGTQLRGNGGGVSCRYASPAFDSCTVRYNSVDGHGGGVSLRDDSSPTFTNCDVRGNWASVGGGLYCDDSVPPASFTDCVIGGNGADSLGGGVYGEGDFTNCILMDNSTNGQGGAIYCHYFPSFTNCVLANNSATGNGGGVACDVGSGPTFVYCTLSGNSTSGDGGGVYCLLSSIDFNSTIIAFSEGAGVHFDYAYMGTLEYCDVFGNDTAFAGDVPEGIGDLVILNANGDPCDIFYNILLDPVFFDRTSPDCHLHDTSPCIGAADPMDPPPADIEGNPRPNPAGSNPDIGAYESEYGEPGHFSIDSLVISISNGNAVLHWPDVGATCYNIYGAIEPFALSGILLDTVTDTTWSDEATSSRPASYFYCVTAIYAAATVARPDTPGKVKKPKTSSGELERLEPVRREPTQ